MKTRDQQEMEFQCQRRHKKAKDLDPRHSKEYLQAMECLKAMELEGHRRLRVEEVEERAREQLRVEDAARAKFRIDIEASTNPTANTELVTNEHTREMRSHSYDHGIRRTAIKPCLLLKQARQGSRYKEHPRAENKPVANSYIKSLSTTTLKSSLRTGSARSAGVNENNNKKSPAMKEDETSRPTS